MKNTILIMLITVAIIAALFAIDCGIIYLICLCFNWKFQWKIAIGIMLLLSLVGSFFRGGSGHAN